MNPISNIGSIDTAKEEEVISFRFDEVPLPPPPPPPPPPPHRLSKLTLRTFRPWFTAFTVANLTLAFLLGGAMSGWKFPSGLSDFSVLVPNEPSLTFRAYLSWSDGCVDVRSEWWRLFTYQFVHAGLFHYLFNMLAILSYGMILECLMFNPQRRWLRTRQCFCVFHISVVAGALGNVYEFPYSNLVGASPGIYGLIGQ